MKFAFNRLNSINFFIYQKVLLEKIIRALFSVDRVYLLLRSKSGQTAQQRLGDLLKSPAFSFNRLDPQQLKKLVAISGDLTQPDLGLKDTDRRLLCSKVHIVYHVAASVKFDASFRYVKKEFYNKSMHFFFNGNGNTFLKWHFIELINHRQTD